MSFFRRLLYALGFYTHPPGDAVDRTERHFELDDTLQASLQDLADREHREVEEMAFDLLQQAVDERQAAAVSLQSWQRLTPRQHEIAALICLGYTNQRIASRLKISPETVKTHIRNLLNRFGARTKADLRRILAHWDFSGWG